MHILIQAVWDLLPASLLSRKKMGFGVPLNRWLRISLKGFIADHLPGNTRKTELPSEALTRVFLARLGARTAPFALLSARPRRRGIISMEFAGQLIEEHRAERRDNSQWLRTPLMLDLRFLQLEASS